VIIGLQLLRILAAAFVVLAHTLFEYEWAKPFGTFGVDIFFVISGFIIVWITENNCDQFFVKRLVRILPMYWLFTFGISSVAYFLPSALRSATFDINHIVASLLFIPYWTEGTGFAPILGLGWTLNFEMAFYLIFYISLLISHKYRALISSLFIFSIFYLLNSNEFYNEFSPFVFYSNGLWFEFIFGMFVALIFRKYQNFEINFFYFCGVSFLSLSGLVYLQLNSLSIAPRFAQFGFLSMILVIAFIGFEKGFLRLGNGLKKTILWMGEVSYPLYLIHSYVIGVIHRLLFKDINFPLLFILSLVGSVVASHFVSLLFDKPIRRFLTRKLDLPPKKLVQGLC
jgi:exopolysaccharide production protein ExoZ